MIEKIILKFLENKLDVGCYAELPEDNSKTTFIVIEKTGSSKTNELKGATIAIKSYAPSLFEASDLNEKVKDAMSEIISLDSISSCSLNSDYNYTDESMKYYRYQAVFDLFHY